MAKRLIDARKLQKLVKEFRDEAPNATTRKHVCNVILSMLGDETHTPTVDAVEVVKCRDCRWRGSEQCAMFYRCDCGEQHTWETDDDYCSYGERKDGGQAPQREDA